MEALAAKKRVLILGGGFAGAYTALHLEKQLASASDAALGLTRPAQSVDPLHALFWRRGVPAVGSNIRNTQR